MALYHGRGAALLDARMSARRASRAAALPNLKGAAATSALTTAAAAAAGAPEGSLAAGSSASSQISLWRLNRRNWPAGDDEKGER